MQNLWQKKKIQNEKNVLLEQRTNINLNKICNFFVLIFDYVSVFDLFIYLFFAASEEDVEDLLLFAKEMKTKQKIWTTIAENAWEARVRRSCSHSHSHSHSLTRLRNTCHCFGISSWMMVLNHCSNFQM